MGVASGIRPIHREVKERQIPPSVGMAGGSFLASKMKLGFRESLRQVIYAALWASSSTFSLGQVARSRTFPEFEEMWT
jgi:hypothetical protein